MRAANGYSPLAEQGKVLITGASAGLGKALVEEFQCRGYQVLAAGRSREALEKLSAVSCYPLDLSIPGAGAELAARVRSDGHGVDVLVCNAGLGLSGAFGEQSPEALDALVQVNIAALTALNRAFLPEMRERGAGRVLNVASTGAWQPGPYMAAYYASKAYVLSLTRALREEYKGTGVTVSALCPGSIATEFSRRSGRADPGRAMTPEKVAKIAVDGLLRGKGVITPGLENKALHAASKALPAPLMAKFVAGYQKKLL